MKYCYPIETLLDYLRGRPRLSNPSSHPESYMTEGLLEGLENWWLWYFDVKGVAEARNIWCMDPEVPRDQLTQIPDYLLYPNVAESVDDLNDEKEEYYRELRTRGLRTRDIFFDSY